MNTGKIEVHRNKGKSKLWTTSITALQKRDVWHMPLVIRKKGGRHWL